MSENRKFQLNIKFGAGYEAPLLNIEGDSAQEFQANVEFAVQSVEALVNATTLFQAAYNVSKPQDPPPAPRVQQAAPQDGGASNYQTAPGAQPQGPWSQQGTQQSQAPAFMPQAPAQAPQQSNDGLIPQQHCSHGPMQLRRAKPESGKKWVAYMCPTPQGTPGQCSPVDAKTGKSWN